MSKKLIKSVGIDVYLNKYREMVETAKTYEALNYRDVVGRLVFNENISSTFFKIEKVIKDIDKIMWRELITNLPFFDIMSSEKKKEWYELTETGSRYYNGDKNKKVVPAFTAENIEATIIYLNNSKGDLITEKVDELFRGLSWNYKTNKPIGMTEKIIISNFGSFYGGGRDKLDCLEDVLYMFEKKPLPTYDQRFIRGISMYNPCEHENEYFRCKKFKNGNVHLWFKSKDHVKKLNFIIAKKYGKGALAKRTK